VAGRVALPHRISQHTGIHRRRGWLLPFQDFAPEALAIMPPPGPRMMMSRIAGIARRYAARSSPQFWPKQLYGDDDGLLALFRFANQATAVIMLCLVDSFVLKRADASGWPYFSPSFAPPFTYFLCAIAQSGQRL
jgi:hypothetical protein